MFKVGDVVRYRSRRSFDGFVLLPGDTGLVKGVDPIWNVYSVLWIGHRFVCCHNGEYLEKVDA